MTTISRPVRDHTSHLEYFPAFRIYILIFLGFLMWRCSDGSRSVINFRAEDPYLYFNHENIRLRLDKNMYMKVDFFDGEKVLTIHDVSNAIQGKFPNHFITLNGKSFTDFSLNEYQIAEINESFFGTGKRLTLTGELKGIEKTMYIDLYEQYPDVAVTWCRYRNLTDSILTIDNLHYNYFPLNRKLVNSGEPAYRFHYLQPLNREWGETWTNLAVTDTTSEEFRIPFDGSNHSGVPFLDVWGREMGMALFHVEGIQRYLQILLQVRDDRTLHTGFKTIPGETFGQFSDRIFPDSSVTTWKTAVCVHKGDFFNGARRFGEFLDGALRTAGRKGLIKDYPEQAYEPYWKTWGMNSLDGSRQFSPDQVLRRLDQLADAGFKAIMLDAGWNTDRGLWTLDARKFVTEAAFKTFVNDLHTAKWGQGKDKNFKVYLWFDLLGADTLCGTTKPLLVKNGDGSLYQSIQTPYAFCPSHEPTLKYLEDSLIHRIIGEWDVDGLYTDLEDQNPLPCYDPEHRHAYPAENMEHNYLAFQRMHDGIMELKPVTGWTSQCACAAVHDVYQYPYYWFEDASDPVTNEQVRWRVRWIKAVRGPKAPAGDGYVDKMNYDRKAGEPAQSVAIGSVITSVRWNVDELGGQKHAEKWMKLYESEGLSSGEYLGLYDIAYDKPEGHVIKKDNGSLYYSFFNNEPFELQVELRGLEPELTYRIFDYEDGIDLGNVSGNDPFIRIVSKTGNGQGERLYYAVLKCICSN